MRFEVEKSYPRKTMKFSTILIVIILSGVKIVAGIQCYQCNYVEGEENGQDDCELEPPDNYLQTCGTGESVSDSELVLDHEDGSDEIVDLIMIENATFGKRPANHGGRMFDIICVKGIAVRNGREIVSRGCAVTGKPENLDGKCEPIRGFCDHRGCYIKRQLCYCTHNGCNGAGTLSSISFIILISLGVLIICLKL